MSDFGFIIKHVLIKRKYSWINALPSLPIIIELVTDSTEVSTQINYSTNSNTTNKPISFTLQILQKWVQWLLHTTKWVVHNLLTPVKTISLNPFTPKSHFVEFTLPNARRFYSVNRRPLGSKRVISSKSDFKDFTLANARRFYSSQEDPSGLKGLRDCHSNFCASHSTYTINGTKLLSCTLGFCFYCMVSLVITILTPDLRG